MFKHVKILIFYILIYTKEWALSFYENAQRTKLNPVKVASLILPMI